MIIILRYSCSSFNKSQCLFKQNVFNLIHEKFCCIFEYLKAILGTNIFQYSSTIYACHAEHSFESRLKNPPVAQPKHEQIHGLITSKVEIWQLTVYPTPPKKLWTTATQWHLITMQHVVHMPRNHVCIDRWRSNFLPINYINFIGGAVVVTSSMIYMQKQMLYVSWGAHMKFFKLRSNKIHQEQNNNNNSFPKMTPEYLIRV